MKERVFKFEIGILFLFALLSSVLVFAVFVWGWKYAPDSQTLSSNVKPASAPADIGELTTRVDNLENSQNNNLKVFEWQLDQKLLILGWIALFISFAAGFLGMKTYNDLDKVIKERVNQALEKALYQLDPTNLPIHIYKGHTRRNAKGESPRTAARDSLPGVDERLRLTGLLNRGFIKYLDKTTLSGITIIPMDDEKDEEGFIDFVKEYEFKLHPEKSGFILYAPFGYTIKKAQDVFENTVIANMPATVASMVLVVGRGLKNREDA